MKKQKYMKKKKNNKEEFENIIVEKIQKSVKELIDEKFIDKIDEKKLKENLEKIETTIQEKGEEINKIKSTLEMIDSKNYFDNKVNEYVISNINQNIINNQLIKQLSEEVNELNKKNIDNYITLTVLINNNDIGKDIIFINQCNICEYYKNFEFNDIEIFKDKAIIS